MAWPIYPLLLAGLGVTALTALHIKGSTEASAKKDFAFVCAEIANKIEDRLRAHEQILCSAVAFFVDSDGVTRAEWRRFAESQRIEQQLPGIQGLGFALLVPRPLLQRHIEEIRAEGFPSYRVWPDGERDVYSSIIWLEPFTNRNLRAFGYDMLSEPVRRAAMERARDAGATALSGKVRLVQETDTDIQAGTLMYAPVYRSGEPCGTVDQRRTALLGWVYSPYRMDDLVQGIMRGLDLVSFRHVRLEIFDGGQSATPEALLYDSFPAGSRTTGAASLLTVQSRLVSSGHVWGLRFTKVGALSSAVDYGKAWLSLLAGTSISLLLAALLFALLSTRRRAEQIADRLVKDLRKSEEYHRALLRTAMDGIWLVDMQGRLLEVNEAYCRMSGYSAEELLAMRISDLEASETASETAAHIRSTMSECEHRFESRHRRKDGSLFDLEVRCQHRPDDGGHIVAFLHDITARRRTEDELRDSHALLANLARLVPGVVYQYRLYPDGRSAFPYASPGMSDIYEVTPEEVRDDATPVFGRLHPDDYDHVATAIQESARTLRLFHCEFRVILPRQGLRWRWSEAHPERTADGGTLWYGTIQDITQRKRDEAELQKMDKLQSLGMLAGGIAHDFNNILTGVYGNLSLAKDDLPAGHHSRAPLEEAETSMLRAVRLTRQLLTFAKGGAPVKESVGLGPMVEEVARFDLAGSNVSLVYRQAEDLWPVDADKGQLQQVVSNLVINARQAMPKGGLLTVALENAELPAGAVSTLPAGRYVKVGVQDQGGGIDRQMLPQIFDPYFTTKHTGHGLGLATVWSIVNKHGGYIGVESELGKGSTFMFYLPASAEPAAAEMATPAAENPPPPIRHARVLVLDDEKMLRDLVTSMLERCGHTAATAPDGQDAIALYRQSLEAGTPFDLVIMDLTIPGGLGGVDAIKTLRALDPHVRAIVSSGYAEDPVMANPAKYGFMDTVAKPYTLRGLRDVVARVLR